MLDDLELQLVQQLEAAERQERAQHAIPALEGDFLQGLGRRATSFTLAGVIANDDGTVSEELKKLREKFRAAAPVDFVADIATATRVDTVLIEEMSVRELAGKPERFEYAFALREFIPAPAPEIEPPPPPPPPLETSLIVDVRVEGQPGFDFSQVKVTVKGTQEDGASLDRTLINRTNNIWTEATFPPGSYTVRATAPDPIVPNTVMVGEVHPEILEGEKENVLIVLAPGQRRNVATAFVIHYWFDKAFIEPCLRPVLREVAQFAATHDAEKFLIVGHTDLVGSDEYNQALSERRSRGVHAFLTFKNDENASVAEWNELRKTRPVGQATSLNDTWGAREYQYILQDLGFYAGPINEKHDKNTESAVLAFQQAKSLTETGIVDDATWPKLIRDYLAQDSLSVDKSRFFRNARDACDGGPLLWVGCGELDPVDNRKTAWRPNRRTEMLFVVADEIPCELPQPVTWTIRPGDPAGSPTPPWCLGPGNKNQPCCFISRAAEAPNKLLVQPAHPEKVKVSGRIAFENGTPFAQKQFALLASDGEFLHTDPAGQADLGEVPTGAKRGRPIFDRTDDDGRFSYPKETLVGIYILELPELDAPEVAREATAPPHTARGNVVCLDYQPGKTLKNVVIQSGAVNAPPVNPSITLARNFVIVKKPHTNPARVQVTLRADISFDGTGTLERSGNLPAVHLFTAATGGTEIIFNGTDNVFHGTTLAAGVQLFAESGPAPSGAVGDYILTLTLNPIDVIQPAGPPTTTSLTAVLFTLDIALSRLAPGAAPPIMSEADKINIGRHVQLPDASFSHERAMLIVRQPVPAIPVTLELLPQNGRVRAFTQEIPAAGQAAIVTPFVLVNVPPAGSQFFVEAVALSTALRDTAYLLGVQGDVAEVDRVAITTCAATLTTNVAPFNIAVARVQIEGILNQELNPSGGTFALADLFGTQVNALFRIRVDIVGIAGNTVVASLTSTRTGGAQIELRTVTLTRTTGNRFVSLPMLAIPDAIPRGEITFAAPQDIEVIRARAGGRLRLAFDTGTGVATQVVRVRGRVVHIFASAITGAGINTVGIRNEIQISNRIWAQAGLEVRERGINSSVADPGTLLDLDGFDIAPFTGTLTAEERTLLALNRSPVNSDVNIYYVRSIDNGASGEGISSDEFAAVVDPTDSGVILAVTAFNTNQAHEVGHLLIHNGDEHSVGGVARPAANLMHPFSVAGQRNLDSGQVLRAIRVGNPFVAVVE